MHGLAALRIKQLSELRDASLRRSLAFEARGLPQSARLNLNAALVAERKLQALSAAVAAIAVDGADVRP